MYKYRLILLSLVLSRCVGEFTANNRGLIQLLDYGMVRLPTLGYSLVLSWPSPGKYTVPYGNILAQSIEGASVDDRDVKEAVQVSTT